MRIDNRQLVFLEEMGFTTSFCNRIVHFALKHDSWIHLGHFSKDLVSD
jgi:hypothetical protein